MNRFFGPVPITRRPLPVARFDGDNVDAFPVLSLFPAAAEDDDDDDEPAFEGGLKVYAVGPVAPLPAPSPLSTDFRLKWYSALLAARDFPSLSTRRCSP